MNRLDEMYLLDIKGTYLLALGCNTLLCNEFFSIHAFSIPVDVLSSEDYLELRMKVIAEFHKV